MSIRPLKSLATSSLGVTRRSENACRNLNSSSELGHFESTPVCGPSAMLRVCAVMQQQNEHKYYFGHRSRAH
jgi:hypothetical protein